MLPAVNAWESHQNELGDLEFGAIGALERCRHIFLGEKKKSVSISVHNYYQTLFLNFLHTGWVHNKINFVVHLTVI